ncbi:DNA damage-regulated autophagy modulator protein 1-like [Varroa jacobsoni]|uniref:CWH43-like N-terminal domain-containing protein n=1 Tax=Varroa destructor TaxID=109461 RepID=A0A7M7K193_VARDE|nr:DNA damage-regulated autophagy modulator protein 1-like [Varroa destructor]XP_022660159.1 DNA damage-regulated autophagy modulator protein 1-like [Varroa destructor]XP_022660160.1 DNA damage-regulated autophagy modulator protein 1-like [Varroa destructor]XP_022660161.1 DNA damage-regulated autophagy modulator protein 1-like [Varroa destructor]XP_022660162.1 DNA damage-regulated autophagy modulator protein 1-like [Varroa destructor]XP_022660163.1 DNA damage-regulated autophagy modulator prot
MHGMAYTRTNNPVKFIGVGWIPAGLGVCIATAALVSFVWAVLSEDVTVFAPFISETGADPPQSGFFSLMILVSCIWSAVTMVLRYSIVRQLLRFNQGGWLNFCALAVGFLCIFGLAIVAAYPLTSSNGIHDFGATTMFLLGVVYCLMQSILSAWMYPWHNGKVIVAVRAVITTIAVTTAITTTICQVTAKRLWLESGITKPDDMRLPGDPAFSWFMAAAVSEWITVAMFVTYFFSFIREFNKVVLELDTYPLVDHFDDDIEIRFASSEHTPLYKSVL